MLDDDLIEIDRLSTGLIAEFKEHYRAYSEIHPDADRRLVFEGWILQKIAAIHYILGDRSVPLIVVKKP